ncbi:GRAS family transcription factor [Striga asiatica]|uniref:GRAS family transcription factor n=1 Tax=Striga asiatica TaxID=4170 RepID=A0A5A7RHE5_STRAF|nr:GRAS family transcription factor [Striga asiatica]
MESSFYGFGVTNIAGSYYSSCSTPTTLVPSKSNSGCSPNSPLPTYFHQGTKTYDDNMNQYDEYNSSLDHTTNYHNYYYHPHLSEYIPQIPSDQQQMRHALHELETALMSTDDDEPPADVAAPTTAPHLKFRHMATLGAIAEACGNEARIHIVDFWADCWAHWAVLLRALAGRPGGPPSVRITAVDPNWSESLEAVGKQLEEVSREFVIPVEFRVVPEFCLTGVRPGEEALAVNFGTRVGCCDLDGIVGMVRLVGARVVTAVEEEMRWRSRMVAGGFRKFPLSSYVSSVTRELLGCYSEHYSVVEEDGAVMLRWKGRTVISASAWQ